MSLDLFEADDPWSEAPRFVAERKAPPRAYSVSAVNAMARRLLEGTVPPLWVAGEVTGWKRHRSGHCYFALRDATARLRCVMFRTEAQRLPTEPEEGMEVRVLGTLTLPGVPRSVGYARRFLRDLLPPDTAVWLRRRL